jgi:hypothetical protein
MLIKIQTWVLKFTGRTPSCEEVVLTEGDEVESLFRGVRNVLS